MLTTYCLICFNPLKVIFTGVSGSSFTGDIAINDFHVRAGSCPLGKQNYCFQLIVHFASLPQSSTRKAALSKMEERIRTKIE